MAETIKKRQVRYKPHNDATEVTIQLQANHGDGYSDQSGF